MVGGKSCCNFVSQPTVQLLLLYNWTENENISFAYMQTQWGQNASGYWSNVMLEDRKGTMWEGSNAFRVSFEVLECYGAAQPTTVLLNMDVSFVLLYFAEGFLETKCECRERERVCVSVWKRWKDKRLFFLLCEPPIETVNKGQLSSANGLLVTPGGRSQADWLAAWEHFLGQ